MKKIIYLSVMAVIAMLVAGCEPQGFEPDNDGKVLSIAVKEAVYISGTQSMQISFKDNIELQLNVVIMPQNAKNQKVTFTNKHPELMTVTEDGLLKPKAVGTDTLIVSATDGSGVSTRFVVNIIDHMVKATAINIAAEALNRQLKIGGASFDLGAYVTLSPVDTWDTTVTYTSNDESIVTVTSEGVVTPVNIGSTTVTIKTADGSNLSVDWDVSVLDKTTTYVDIVRTNWKATTTTHSGYGYVWDTGSEASHITGKPEHLFDGQTGSFLSLLKPGGTANGITAPADSEAPSFTVDMGTAQEFDYIKWNHRYGSYTNDVGSINTNNVNFLRVFGVIVEGSNDGTNFTMIAPEEPAGADENIIWIPQKASYVASVSSTEDAPYIIPIANSTYRYVRVNLTVQSKNYAPDKYQHPDYPGNGYTSSGNTMQIAEFGLGKIVIE